VAVHNIVPLTAQEPAYIANQRHVEAGLSMKHAEVHTVRFDLLPERTNLAIDTRDIALVLRGIEIANQLTNYLLGSTDTHIVC
jgi:hypothetical protein